jgi:predicted transcriptional regulator
METVTRLCKRVLKMVREYFSKLKTIDELNKFQIHINNTIKIVNKAIKNKLHKNNVLESLHSLESSLSYLKYYRLKLKKLKQNLILKTGGKLSTNLNRNCLM